MLIELEAQVGKSNARAQRITIVRGCINGACPVRFLGLDSLSGEAIELIRIEIAIGICRRIKFTDSLFKLISI